MPQRSSLQSPLVPLSAGLDGLSYFWSLQVVLPLCEAVSYLHSLGIIHGAIKAKNIVIVADGSIKARLTQHPLLGDFEYTFLSAAGSPCSHAVSLHVSQHFPVSSACPVPP